MCFEGGGEGERRRACAPLPRPRAHTHAHTVSLTGSRSGEGLDQRAQRRGGPVLLALFEAGHRGGAIVMRVRLCVACALARPTHSCVPRSTMWGLYRTINALYVVGVRRGSDARLWTRARCHSRLKRSRPRSPRRTHSQQHLHYRLTPFCIAPRHRPLSCGREIPREAGAIAPPLQNIKLARAGAHTDAA